MDIQLQELIEKIKKDGIAVADDAASQIKQAAEDQASSIIAEAHKQAEGLLTQAKQAAARLERSATAAVEQAARNAILSFKAELDRLLAALVERQLNQTFDDEVLKSALPELIKNWRPGSQVDIILPVKTLDRLNDFFLKALAEEVKKGVELKPERGLQAGFKILAKDGSAYYDFSAPAVAELLSAYVSPRLAELLTTAVAVDEQ